MNRQICVILHCYSVFQYLYLLAEYIHKLTVQPVSHFDRNQCSRLSQVLFEEWNFVDCLLLYVFNSRLAGCQTGRRSKENAQQMKEYFSTVVALRQLDFSNTTLNADILKVTVLESFAIF